MRIFKLSVPLFVTLLLFACKGDPGDIGPVGGTGADGAPAPTATATAAPVTILSEGFENALLPGWTVTFDSAVFVTSPTRNGTYALDIGTAAQLEMNFALSPAITKGYVECWIYDDILDSQVNVIFEVTGTKQIAIATNVSATNYALWVPYVPLIITPISRSTGWHNFKFVIDGDTFEYYIDSVKVQEILVSTGIDNVRIRKAIYADPGLTGGAVDDVKIVRY